MPDDNDATERGDPSHQNRPWSEKESARAFELLGDRFIDATRRYLRSQRRLRMQAELYTIDGRELTLVQIDALEAVAQAGELRMNELAAQLHVDPSTATRTTAPLVDLELLERETDPNNRRYVILRCTERGTETTGWIIGQRRHLMRQVLAGMAPDRRLALAELLEEYLTLVDAKDWSTLDDAETPVKTDHLS